MSTTTKADFDAVDFIMRLEGEADDLTQDEVIEGFQHLIDTGMVWSLQGSYGRAAMSLIEQGYCTESNREE